MRDKLRQMDEMFLDLIIGVLLCGVISGILGMIITRGNLWYLLGAAVGTTASVGILIHMTVCIQNSLYMEVHQASRYMVKCSMIRYFIMLLILVLSIKAGNLICFIGVVAGFLSSKISAFLNKPIHKYITAKITKN